MITISLIWINVVISGFILAAESEAVGAGGGDDGLSASSSLPLGEEERDADGHPALPPRTSTFVPSITLWPSRNGLHPWPLAGCLSVNACCLHASCLLPFGFCSITKYQQWDWKAPPPLTLFKSLSVTHSYSGVVTRGWLAWISREHRF